MASTSTFTSSNANDYELQMGRWSRRLAPLFVDFSQIDHADQVLDVGCGTGNLSTCLSENREIRNVTGIDVSPAYVDYATRHAQDGRLTFQVADACELPFADAKFDHSVSLLVLQFVPQSERAVREMRRVTRPGGIVAAATWDTSGGLIAYRMVFDTAALIAADGASVRSMAYGRGMRRFGELSKTWHQAGLVDVVESGLTIRMDFTSFNDFWAPAEASEGPVAAYVGTLDRAARSKLKKMVKLAYCEGQNDGPRSFAATAWAVRGKVVV
jgi:SAM-dependent methyltransferase